MIGNNESLKELYQCCHLQKEGGEVVQERAWIVQGMFRAAIETELYKLQDTSKRCCVM